MLATYRFLLLAKSNLYLFNLSVLVRVEWDIGRLDRRRSVVDYRNKYRDIPRQTDRVVSIGCGEVGLL